MSQKIIIPLSRAKITLLFIGSLLFLVLGLYLTIDPAFFVTAEHKNVDSIRLAGILSVAFFGVTLLVSGIKLFDTRPGLIIDEKGITENSNILSVGLVKWDDIQSIEKVKVYTSRILLVRVQNHEKYISQPKFGMVRRVLQSNYEKYGTPVQIMSSSLKIRFDDLEKLIGMEFKKRKSNAKD